MRHLLQHRSLAKRVAALALLPLLLAGCARGTYAVDMFPEQHYQQSYKRQEPPRLTPPDGAVPITGREVALAPEAAAKLPNPTKADFARSAETYRVNCSMCHGVAGKGDGGVGDRLVTNNYIRPPDLTAGGTQGKSDGDLFNIITNGIVVMPKFGLLLPEKDRWEMVHYLKGCLTNAACAPKPGSAPAAPSAPAAGGH